MIEEEKVDEIEEEEFIRQKYSRDDEDPIPWSIEELANRPENTINLGFYPLNQFAIFKNLMRPNETLKFPDYLWISRNHFHLEWTFNRTLRRLKNVIVILEWEPKNNITLVNNSAAAQLAINASKWVKNVASGTTASTLPTLAPTGAIEFTKIAEAALERCFAMFDTDGDGKLTKDDIGRVSLHHIT